MSVRRHLGEQMTDAAMSSAGSKILVGGVTTTGMGWLSANTVAAVGGLIIAVIGLVVQIVYKAREDRRLAERHALEIERLRRP